MKYNELFTTNGLFAEYFAKDYPAEFKEIFGTWKSANIDMFAVLKYGRRELLDFITEDTVRSYVDAVICMNVDRWLNVMKLLNIEYDALKPVTRETTITAAGTAKTIENSENNNAQKAFNDETFTDGERGTDTRTQNRESTENRSNSVAGIGSARTYSDVIQKEKELRNAEYRQRIVEDIIKELTVQIY